MTEAATDAPKAKLFYGWIIVGVCFLSWLVADAFGFYTFGLYILPISNEMGWSTTTITGALTMKMLTGAVIGPFIGYVTDMKYGARILMSLGALVAGGTTFMISFVQTPFQFYLLYGAIGSLGMIGFGGLVTHTIIAKWFIRMRGRAMGIATLGVSVSGVLFIPLTHYMIDTHGWRASLRLVGIIMWIAALLPSLIFIRRRPEDMGLSPDGDTIYKGTMGEGDGNGGPAVKSWTVREVLKSKILWILLAAFNITGLSLNGIMVHFYPFMENKGISMDIAAGAMSLFAACCAVVKIPWGFFAEKFKVQYCIIAIFIGGAVGQFIILNASSTLAVFAYAIVYGTALGGLMVLREVLFADYFGHEFLGAIRGVIMPINVLCMSASPLLAAWLYEISGSYKVPYTLFMCTFILGAFFMLFAKQPDTGDR